MELDYYVIFIVFLEIIICKYSKCYYYGMVRKEDLYWSESDTDAIKEYKKQFEAGKIPHTILNNGSKDTTQTKEEMMCLIFETAHKMKKGEIPVATQYDSIQDFIDDKRKT